MRTTRPPTWPFRGAIDEQVGIEVALPIIPQAPGVGFQRRDDDAGRFQQPFGVAIVETRGIVDEGEDAVGRPDRP